LTDFPAIVAWFWEMRTRLVNERLLIELGMMAYLERTEYQSRGSAHGHSLGWNPNAPPDIFLDVIVEFAQKIAKMMEKIHFFLIPLQVGRKRILKSGSATMQFVSATFLLVALQRRLCMKTSKNRK
jgi:hypothetical protein